jgi:archaellum component FlaC
VAKILSILTIIGMAFGVFFYVDAHYAKCAEVKAIERRLDYKIESDKLTATQARLWSLEDRYGSDPDKVQNPEIKQQMKELKSSLNGLEDRVKKLGE